MIAITESDKFIDFLVESISSYECHLCTLVWNHQQAKIDRLMFEYCPEEMTPEQIKKFEEHQKCATS